MKKAFVLPVILISLFASFSSLAQVNSDSKGFKPAPANKPATKAGNQAAPVVAPKPVIDPILLSVGEEQVPRSEFERVFKKNNKDTVFTEKSVRDYLDLYINYKLKVKEAETLKMDTSENFKSELAGYRKQLAQPYLTDKNVSEQLVKEAYDRLKNDVRASHILIKCTNEALPKDTVIAYNRALKISDMILKGADFSKVARDSSEDPSAKDNGGDLGYFTGMQMVYPFETAAYSNKIGTLSMPVRTRFGYHIIKTIDLRPAQGEIHVAHLMIRMPKDANDSIIKIAESKIKEAQAMLNSGASWDTVVTKYSEDKASAKKGGDLPWFGTGRMVPEFEKAAFALQKDGEISSIVKTTYGWHIIKRIEKRGMPTFEEKKGELRQMIMRDSRNETSRLSMVNKIKAEYRFKEVPKSKDAFINTLDTSLASGEWDLKKADSFNGNLFSLTDSTGTVKNYSVQDFAKYISTHQTKRASSSPQAIGYSMYDQWMQEEVLAYEEARLDNKYVDFKNLMKEYRDGILLFDLTDKMVWTKAVKDTIGLQQFHEKTQNNYMWGERCNATIFQCNNETTAADFRKQLVKGKKSMDDIMAAINKKTPNAITKKEAKYAHSESELIEKTKWVEGISNPTNLSNNWYIVDLKILPPMPKSLNEAKGLVTSDYQSALEKEWVDELKAKYPVKVNQEILQTIWSK
jgi:peptidyl-prolyl cis-trans isomerase SurA